MTLGALLEELLLEMLKSDSKVYKCTGPKSFYTALSKMKDEYGGRGGFKFIIDLKKEEIGLVNGEKGFHADIERKTGFENSAYSKNFMKGYGVYKGDGWSISILQSFPLDQKKTYAKYSKENNNWITKLFKLGF